MENQDGPVPTPRRAVPRAVDAAAAAPRGTERVPELAALLREIDGLRTTLSTDLSLAAAALEAGAEDLAAELVDGDLAEVRRFSLRADGRLTAMAASDADRRGTAGEVATAAVATAAADAVPAPPSALDAPGVVPVAALRPRRRLMSAAPLLAAAAALLGFAAGVVPDRGTAPQPATSLTSATMASDELYRLISLGAPDEALREAAEEVNAELAELLVEAQDDPAASERALVLLDSTTSVLAGQGDSGVLRAVMAEARALRARLRAGLPALAEVPLRPLPLPTVPALPVPQRPDREPSTVAETTPPASSPASSAPTPTPASSPAPRPQPQPETEPTPSSDGSAPGSEVLQPGFGF